MYFQLARPNADIARFSWVGRWIWALGWAAMGWLHWSGLARDGDGNA